MSRRCRNVAAVVISSLLVLFSFAIGFCDYVRDKLMFVILSVIGILMLGLMCAIIPSNPERPGIHDKQANGMCRVVSSSTLASLRYDLCILCLSPIEDYERDFGLVCCGRRLHEDCVLMAISFGNRNEGPRCPECRTTVCLPI